MKGVLKEYLVQQKTKISNLTDIKALNMWGYELEDISLVEKMPNLERVTFSVNNIQHLHFFINCPNLIQLHLRKNLISNFYEIEHLKQLSNLRELTLLENPISDLPNYREKIISMLPQLEILDQIRISDLSNKKETIKIIQKENININLLRKSNITSLHPKKKLFNENISHIKELEINNKINNEIENSVLNAVLSLIPKMSNESLQIVIDEIKNRSKLRI